MRSLLISNCVTARELAIRYVRELCHAAGVQLLDQTVSMTRLRIARVDGLPTLVRRYGFEISLDGSDRHRGHLELRGQALGTWSLPQAADLRGTAGVLGIETIH